MHIKKNCKNLYMKIFSVLLLICFTSFQFAGASVKSYKKDTDGVTCILDKGIMKVKICKDDIAEVKYTFMNSFPPKTSLVINNTWIDKPTFNVLEKENQIIISTKKIKIDYNFFVIKFQNLTYPKIPDNLIN